MRQRRRVLYTGSVQGVGFRYTTRHVASRHPVTGYVRNLPNGAVELCVEGESEAIDGFLGAVEHRMAGYIEQTEITIEAPTDEYKTFDIKH